MEQRKSLLDLQDVCAAVSSSSILHASIGSKLYLIASSCRFIAFISLSLSLFIWRTILLLSSLHQFNLAPTINLDRHETTALTSCWRYRGSKKCAAKNHPRVENGKSTNNSMQFPIAKISVLNGKIIVKPQSSIKLSYIWMKFNCEIRIGIIFLRGLCQWCIECHPMAFELGRGVLCLFSYISLLCSFLICEWIRKKKKRRSNASPFS